MTDMGVQKQTWRQEEEEVGGDGALLGRQPRVHHNNNSGSAKRDGMSVYFEPQQGNVSGHGVSGVEFDGTESSVSESSSSSDEELNTKTKEFVSAEINREVVIDFVKEKISGLSPTSIVQKLHDDQNITNLEGLKNTAEEVDADEVDDLVEETDNEFSDLDLEGVLKKQSTHRLYCPKCNSCITRNVVLIRRRRPIVRIPIKPKPEIAASGQDAHNLNASSNVSPTPPAVVDPPYGTPTPPATDPNNEGQLESPSAVDGHSIDGQPETYIKCLSCFSIFMPIGNGYKVFQCFGGSDEVAIVQEVQERPESKKNWFLDCFSAEKNKPSIENEVIIDLPQSDVSLPVQTLPVITQPVPRQQPADTSVEANNWDILKSIVYGGLVESITSLGVVSSAAGAGATTLSVFAMGLANVIAGLFVIFDNLKELKNEQSEENEQESRYQQLLGRRQNFVRHVIVVVLSYLIFGLVPPVVYGFSFRGSDDRDLKIAALAGSSSVCVFLLALAKAHSQTSPRHYLSTVTYYLTSGVMASGLSYVVGDQFEKFMEQLGLFAPSSEAAMPSLMQTNMMMKPGWSSY